MNLILFEADECTRPLPPGDPRARHVIEILRRKAGDRFDCGLVDGPRGKATLRSMDASGLSLDFAWEDSAPTLSPLRLIVGLPRPQTARKVLLEATTLGVCSMDFVRSDKGEPSYAQSSLWSSGEWRRHLLAGAEQAFCTRLPAVSWELDLAGALTRLPTDGERIALDNYESPERLGALHFSATSATLALGSERGWSARERELLRGAGFRFAHLGTRVLRTETAVVAATTLALSKLGRL